MCTIIFILVCPLLGYILYCTHQRFHPFLISVWSIAGCCDAVWGKPCQSRGNSDISVARDYSADLIVMIRIQAPAPPLRWPHLVRSSPGFWRLFKTRFFCWPSTSPSICGTHISDLNCKHIATPFFSPSPQTPTTVFALKFSLYPCTRLLNPGSLPFCCQCQPDIITRFATVVVAFSAAYVYVCRPVVLSCTIVEKKLI